jgi:hypothetical protein
VSVLKTSAIQSPDSDTPQILLSASGMSFSASALELTGGELDLPNGTTIDGDTISVASDLNQKLDIVAQQSNRNVLYNGAMQVAQRGVSATGVTTSGYRTADRWTFNISSFGTWTETVENDGPTGSGLRKSFKVLCTSANASPAGSNVFVIEQRLEGQDLQRFAKGTASAKTMTISFWVKSNVTGTFIARLADVDNSRHVASSYTVDASATWEKKTISFPADESGLFDNDNAQSLIVQFWLGAGSDFTTGTLATTWEADTPANRAVGQTNVGASVNNYWQITGVQLEAGFVATDFEFKSFGQELAECQRYFQILSIIGDQTQINTTVSWGSSFSIKTFPFLRSLRSSPGVSISNTATSAWQYYSTSATFTNLSSTVSVTLISLTFVDVTFGVDNPPNSGAVRIVKNNSGSPITISVNSEL